MRADRITPEIVDAAVREIPQLDRERLDRAAASARAAVKCGEAGNIEKAVAIVLEVEPLIHEVNTYLNAASLIRRDYKN
jgi:hypothetical protein